MPLPVPKYTSKDFTVRTPIEAPRFIAPFEGVAARYILKIRVMQHAGHYEPLALNTTFPDAGIAGYADFSEMFANEGFAPSDFVFVGETEPTMRGVMQEWEMTFAAVPAQRQEPTQYNYTYPGWIDPAGQTRDPITVESVPKAIAVSDFFLVGSAEYPTQLDIPFIAPFKVFLKLADLPDGSANDSYPNAYITATNNQTLTVPAYDAPVTVGGVIYPAYFPFLESYKTKVKNPDPILITDLLAVQSQPPQRWMGNIFSRTTIYIPPQ